MAECIILKLSHCGLYIWTFDLSQRKTLVRGHISLTISSRIIKLGMQLHLGRAECIIIKVTVAYIFLLYMNQKLVGTYFHQYFT